MRDDWGACVGLHAPPVHACAPLCANMVPVTSTYRTPRSPEPQATPPKPRLIATDLDGTLLRDDKTVSARTIAALTAAEDAGIEVFFVTGRPARWMGVVAEHSRPSPAPGPRHGEPRALDGGSPGRSPGGPPARPSGISRHGVAICANGAAVYDLHRDLLLAAYPLAAEDALAVVAALRAAAPGTAFAIERTHSFHHEPEYTAFFAEPDSVSAPIEELLACATDEPVIKLLAKHPAADPDDFLATARGVAGEHAEFTRSSPSALLEISGVGVSKATTLARCCAERGITADEVVAFGDMPNDLAMLSWAGMSFAVANAHPDVLAVTTHRTTANEDDGVARAIERILDGC